MIEFPCTCGLIFRLDDDQAGGLVQCPDCRRLNDVPTHSELGQIAPDGTYRIDAAAPAHDTDAVVADLQYVYQRGARDAEGNEIDLRLTPEERSAIGRGEPVPLAPGGRVRTDVPRYDPETGELVAPLDIKQEGAADPDAASIPIAKPTLNYATGSAAQRLSFARIFLHLFAPLNLAVLFAVFCMHVLLWPLLLVVFAGIMFLVIAVPILFGMILAHFGNVIEDAGPYERDELPRPLRDLGWHEDLWGPFCGVFASLLVCYGPALMLPGLLLRKAPALAAAAPGTAVVLGAAGTFLFPAVLLTLQTSGTALNLRPDRLMAVIAACGRDYFITLSIWIVTAAVYALGWVGTTLALADVVHSVPVPWWLMAWAVVIPALVVGIFLAHYFCMCLGMLYRVHYFKFPWVLQRHVSTRKPGDPVGLPPSRRRPSHAVPARPQRSK